MDHTAAVIAQGVKDVVRLGFDLKGLSIRMTTKGVNEGLFRLGTRGTKQIIIRAETGRLRASTVKAMSKGKPPWWTSDELANVMHHELGHMLHTTFRGTGNTWAATPMKGAGRKIARKVGRYAQTKPREFVAETFSGLVRGNVYDADVLMLYQRLGGAIAKSWKPMFEGAAKTVVKVVKKKVPRKAAVKKIAKKRVVKKKRIGKRTRFPRRGLVAPSRRMKKPAKKYKPQTKPAPKFKPREREPFVASEIEELSKEAKLVIQKFERKVHAETQEFMFAVDKDGKVLLSKKGGKTYVSFNVEEQGLLQDAVLFTHNHPLVAAAGEDLALNSFSLNDLRMASMAKIKEFRAVGINRLQQRIVFRVDATAKTQSVGRIERIYGEELEKIQNLAVRMWQAGKVETKGELMEWLSHTLIKRVTAKLEWRYHRFVEGL